MRSERSQAHGIAVHIGARIAALARGGEVLVSNTVKDLVGIASLRSGPGRRPAVADPSDHARFIHPRSGQIEPTEVERELDGVDVVLIAHQACYVRWCEVSVARRVAEDKRE
jgi:hypothetical protein